MVEPHMDDPVIFFIRDDIVGMDFADGWKV